MASNVAMRSLDMINVETVFVLSSLAFHRHECRCPCHPIHSFLIDMHPGAVDSKEGAVVVIYGFQAFRLLGPGWPALGLWAL